MWNKGREREQRSSLGLERGTVGKGTSLVPPGHLWGTKWTLRAKCRQLLAELGEDLTSATGNKHGDNFEEKLRWCLGERRSKYFTERKILGVKLDVICRGQNGYFGVKMRYSEVDRWGKFWRHNLTKSLEPKTKHFEGKMRRWIVSV